MPQPISEMLSEFPFFRNFPKPLVGNLASLMAEISYEKGQSILVQGQKNSQLFFLLSGEVGIYVDGGHVVSLNQRGSILGEMSVISGELSSATILAETECQLLSIDANRLQLMSGVDFERLQYAMYRIYSLVLTERLRQTNEKAKKFEQLTLELQGAKVKLEKANTVLEEKVEERTQALVNKNLEIEESYKKLEQHNAELTTSYRKIEELYRNRDLTFQTVEKLYSQHLQPFATLLSSKDEFTDENGCLLLLRREFDKTLDLIRPMTELYQSEKALSQQRVLLADPSKKQQAITKMALGGTGVKLDCVSSFEEGKSMLDEHSYDILFFNSDLMDLSLYAHNLGRSTHFIFITDESIPDYLPKLQGHPFLPNIVSRDELDRSFTVKNIMTSTLKLTGRDIFGLEKYLSWGIDVQSQAVKGSSERADLIDGMLSYFKGVGVRAPLRSRCSTVAEELLMNAIYDAPKDSLGNSLYNHMDRTQEIQLNPEHRGEIRYGTDGVLVALSVSDPFGGLTGKTVLNYLDSCYGGRAGELNRKKGGAGRGLHQIIENSDLVVFNVRPNEKTEVITLFNIDSKDDEPHSPSFHFFTV